MSKITVKTNYILSDGYDGSVSTVYAKHRGDWVTFYDSDGSVIFTINDCTENNQLDAINRLYKLYKSGSFENGKFVLEDGIEELNEADKKILPNN